MSEAINLEKFKKAISKFEEFRTGMKTERDKAGAVQAFEFCYEIAWKTTKRILAARGIEAESPKEVFRKAARDNIIDDPEIWFEFQKMRNLTVHTYELENLETVVSGFESFSKELAKLLSRIEEL